MSRKTVNQIMVDIASSVNQEASAPSAGGAEYDLWLQFINRAVEEWANTNDWEEMRKTYFPAISGTNQATVTLPDDFKKVAASPRLNFDGRTENETKEFPEITEETRGLYGYNDEYFMVGGNSSSGFNMVFHPATLASGASLEIQYYATPTSLASPAQMPVLSDSQYIIDRTIAYIFEARSDPRFQQQESKARDKLLQMIENSNLSKYNSYSNPQYLMTSPLRKRGFRMGRD
jgi:hypothetical protein